MENAPITDQTLLENLPNESDIKQAIEELFNKAKDSNFNSFVASILDISSFRANDGKDHLFLENTRHIIISQFYSNFRSIAELPYSEIANESELVFVRRLQLLGYSQFWECTGIQRLLSNLSKAINGGDYDLNYLLDIRYQSVFEIINKIKAQASQSDLSLSKIIESLYFNKIRNAFAHSDFMIDKNVIIMLDSKPKMDLPFFIINNGTWDKFFKAFINFLKTIAHYHTQSEKTLIEHCPMDISIPNFGNHTILYNKGKWIFKQ